MADEQLVLNSVTLNDGTAFTLEQIDMTPPAKRYEWAQSVDANGSALTREALYENRTITGRLRVVQQSTMDLALAKVTQISGLLKEAERHTHGVALAWTPAGSTKTITFRALTGEIDSIPIDWEQSGWFVRSPVLTFKIVCEPLGRGALVTRSLVTGTGPILTTTVPSVPGDVEADATLTISDQATESRRHLEWGVEQLTYNPSTSLLIDNADLTTSGFAGTTFSDASAYGADTIRATLAAQTQAIAGTGTLAHVGSFRVKARVRASATGVGVRLAWRDGDGPFRANSYKSAFWWGTFGEIDLGTIAITAAETGAQTWEGRLEAYGPTGSTIDIDYLILVPSGEGYGRARAEYRPGPSVLIAADPFTGGTPGDSIDGTVSPTGAKTWATSGAGTNDFSYADAVGGGQNVVRASVPAEGARTAILGIGATADTDFSFTFSVSAGTVQPNFTVGAYVRYVNTNNYARVDVVKSAGGAVLNLLTRVAGTTTTITGPAITDFGGDSWGYGALHELRVVALASGRIAATVRNTFGAEIAHIDLGVTALATGGALQTGAVGFYDLGDTTYGGIHLFDRVSVAVPAPEPIVIYAGHSATITGTGDFPAMRDDPTGAYWGQTPSYWGSRFFLPPAGPANRTARVLVKAYRVDIEAAALVDVEDAIGMQISYTPRYLVVPS